MFMKHLIDKHDTNFTVILAALDEGLTLEGGEGGLTVGGLISD